MSRRNRDLIAFSFPETGGERDPERLRQILAAHLAHERLRTARRWLVAGLALLGGLLWLGAAVSTERLRRLGIRLWAGFAAVTLVVGLWEWKWLRRRERLVRDSKRIS